MDEPQTYQTYPSKHAIFPINFYNIKKAERKLKVLELNWNHNLLDLDIVNEQLYKDNNYGANKFRALARLEERFCGISMYAPTLKDGKLDVRHIADFNLPDNKRVSPSFCLSINSLNDLLVNPIELYKIGAKYSNGRNSHH
jgi:hypothetical protein